MHKFIHIFSPKKIRIAFRRISKESMCLLKCGISVVLLALAGLIFMVQRDIETDPFWTVRYYAPMLENIIMTLIIVAGGALLLDINLLDIRRKK